MIKETTIYQGICDKCGAKLTEQWANYDVVADTLRLQQRIGSIDGQTKHYCPKCWKEVKNEIQKNNRTD